MESILQITFAIVVLLILYKFNIIKLPLRLFFRQTYTGKKISLAYRLFNGGYHHNFVVNSNTEYIVHFDVGVEQGTLLIRMKGILETTFHESETGTIRITTRDPLQSIYVEGHSTKGTCRVELEEAS
ncbi:hypothetical protein [Alteribacillus iranensis]|uniref:Uncharacterized protein n=1 Tax=Alteribacillus iranensis TaxID=930128 RepID=A0A1I2F1E4_9BACI|nr:hypothetical protein [Alteribacillus iranensis]SFE98476.1 hypothetical protein SAMN05192532_1082 [Alteribacillus iranensis]